MTPGTPARPMVLTGSWKSPPARVGVVVMALSAIVLMGWVLDVTILKSVVPGVVSMKANTAIGLGAIGLSLAAVASGPMGRLRRSAWLGGSAVAIGVGAATLVQYINGVDLGIDQLLFVDRSAGQDPPGRPAPATATVMLALGLGTLALSNHDRRVSWVAVFASMAAVAMGLAGLLGQLYAADELVGAGAFFRLALHTSVAVIALGFAVAAATIPGGPIDYLAGATPGARLSRWLILGVVVGLPTLGLIRLTGERLGLYSPSFGLVVMVVLTGSVFIVAGAWAGRWLDRSEEALRRSEARYRAAKDGGLDAFYLFEAVRDGSGAIVDFRIVDLNRIGAAYAQRDLAALIGALISDLRPGVTSTDLFRRYVQATNERVTVEEEFSFPDEAGDTEWYVHQMVPVGDGLAITSRRITERIKADEHLRRTNRELMASIRELRDFASIVSHDLRSPLRRIQAFSEAVGRVVRKSDDAEAIDHFSRIERSTASMQALITALLAYARVGTDALDPVPIELERFVTELSDELRSGSTDAAGPVVECGPLPTIEGDLAQIGQLFNNLLGNAVKFARAGAAPHVWITAREVPELPGRTVLVVRDDGRGFEPAYADRIFGIFERAHDAKVARGTGVGLAICRRVVERHGGTISALGVPGEGAIFTFDLPLAHTAT